MEKTIVDFCIKNNLQKPPNKGYFVRCMLKSLVAKYEKVVEKMNNCIAKPIDEIYIIGGDSQNTLFNKLTANALNIPIYAVLLEAIAVGNILVQAPAKGEIKSDDELQKKKLINIAYPQKYLPTN